MGSGNNAQPRKEFSKSAGSLSQPDDPNDARSQFQFLMEFDVNSPAGDDIRETLERGYPFLYTYNRDTQQPQVFWLSVESLQIAQALSEDVNFDRMRVLYCEKFETMALGSVPKAIFSGATHKAVAQGGLTELSPVTVISVRDFAGMPRDLFLSPPRLQ